MHKKWVYSPFLAWEVTSELISQVDYSGFMTINPQRFGQKYVGKVYTVCQPSCSSQWMLKLYEKLHLGSKFINTL